MSEYISKEWLKEHTEFISYTGMWHETETDEFVSRDTIDSAPTIDIPQWIPTCDRLPSESDYYLVTLVNAFEETEICIAWYADEKDYLGECGWREITDSDFVIAWMPLPQPYKGADDE